MGREGRERRKEHGKERRGLSEVRRAGRNWKVGRDGRKRGGSNFTVGRAWFNEGRDVAILCARYIFHNRKSQVQQTLNLTHKEDTNDSIRKL